MKRIAREFLMNDVYFPSTVHPMSHRDFGTAVLSPWPLDEARTILLPHAAFGTRARRATAWRQVSWIRPVRATIERSGCAWCVNT